MSDASPVWAQAPVTLAKAGDAVALLNEITWHDSVLYDVLLDRRESADAVVLNVRLLTDWEAQQSCDVRITFTRCLSVQAEMNWGVHCMSDGEMIYGAAAYQTHPELDREVEKWRGMPRAGSGIAFFELDMASTGSTLRLIFGELTLEPRSGVGPHSAPPPLMPGATLPD